MSDHKIIKLASRPTGMPDAATFRTEIYTVPALNEGEVRVKGMYYSVDPYMRGRMNDVKSYIPPFQVDAPIAGAVVAEVLESKADNLKPGDIVTGMLPWATEAAVPAKGLQKLDAPGVPPHYFLGILGMPGLTAYFGLLDICKPKAGETVVVSGAAGAVGIVVGQLAKIQGCRVVGIAGSDEKTEMLKKDFGFDEAINYNTVTDMKQAIADACPNGVDVYFDNVGGDISDAVIANINFHARISLCGQIALYNTTEKAVGPRLQPMLLTHSVMMQGFTIGNYQPRYAEGMQALIQWVKDGKLTYTETIVHGFDRLPEAFLGLFSGQNKGKMIVAAE